MRLDDVTAIVLCGGAGSRLGVRDKTLVPVLGRPLVGYTVDALAPQVGHIVLSCGRDREQYESFGLPVIADTRPGQGPLGGIVSALPAVASDWILVHPGDTPFPDPALVARIGPTADARGIAVPRTGRQRQNLVLLLSRAMAEQLVAYYGSGGRAVRQWLDQYEVEGVDMSDVSESFFNVNTPADLAVCEKRLS